MALLPKPYPDEIIGSVITRGVLHSGLSRKHFLESLYGSKKNSSSFLMGTSFSTLELATGLEANELLQQHTVFPYATAFMSEAERRRLIAKALAPRIGQDCLSSLTKNVSYGVPFRRVCEVCIEEELGTFGESYWHRQHLLPATLICLRHNQILAATDITLRGNAHGQEVLLPHMVRHKKLKARMPLEKLHRVAQLTQLVVEGQGAFDSELKHYRSLAVERGYVVENRLVAGLTFSRRFRAFYGDAFLAEAGCLVSARREWPALMLRPGVAVPLAITKHLLLQTFFEFDGGVCSPSELGNKPVGGVRRDYEQLDRDVSLRMLMLWEKAKARRHRMTAWQLLTEAGARSAFKTNRAYMPLSEDLILKFRASDQSKRRFFGTTP